MEPPIRNISDTALWVAVYRAEESERPDAVFHDPYSGGISRHGAPVRIIQQTASINRRLF